MKKYIVPQVDICKAECSAMMALSLKQGYADDSEILSREDVEWMIWSEGISEE